MDKPGFNARLRQSLFGGLTGRRDTDVSGRPDGDLRRLLQTAFGEGRRPGGVDTRAAAEGLGVTQRTVQRWLAGQDRQSHGASPVHMKAIAAKARQAASTQAGRRAATAPVRQGRLSRNGARLTVRGKQGPMRAGNDYRRVRAVDFDLQPRDVDGLLSAYEQEGDKGAVRWLEKHADETYVADWSFESIQDLNLRDLEDPDL